MYSLRTGLPGELENREGYTDLEVDIIDHNQKVDKYEGKIMPRATIETLIKERDGLRARIKVIVDKIHEEEDTVERTADSQFTGGAVG